MHLNRAPRSLIWRTLRRRVRRVARQPIARWVAREPETVVRIPPIDDVFVRAVRLIAPQYDWLRADERSRLVWERDQNSSCWTEDTALSPLLRAMPPPRRVLEIGPGLGRSAVFFSQRYFPHARFDLFDATGEDTKYELLGGRSVASFCGNLELLRRTLDFNEVHGYRILDARLTDGRLPPQDEPYDFIYSFWSVGFHWALDHWLDEILSVAHPGTLCAFIVPSHYQPSPWVASLPHVMLEASPALRASPLATTYFLVFTPKPVSWLPA